MEEVSAACLLQIDEDTGDGFCPEKRNFRKIFPGFNPKNKKSLYAKALYAYGGAYGV
ncbi:hypothetical protein [uncultured Faecalibaculum sp.]|nr:hypothetical protein [uncultured Faecalibaculum sp.]